MAMLRRGKVTTPHKSSSSLMLTRMDGSRVLITINFIIDWEEHQFSNTSGKVVTVHHDLSCTAVRESFDAINEMINGKAVQP